METLVSFGHPADSRTVPARWRGLALAVHAPVTVDPNDKPTRGHWAITHHGSGMRAGTYRGPLRDAIRLARTWDRAFAAALVGCDHGDGRPGARRPNLADWPHAAAWVEQVNGRAPIAEPPAAPSAVLPPVAGAMPARAPVCFSDGDGGEQLPVTPTLWPVTVKGERRIRLARTLPSGRQRLRHPETGAPLRMDGDIAAFKRKGDPEGAPLLRLLWRGSWRDIPSMAEFGEWTFDSVCETPDGDPCEPDAPNSWLRLCGLV